MPKILCKCGTQIRLNDIPNKYTYLYMSDIEFDNYSNMVDVEKLYLAMNSFIKCPNCHRIWLYEENKEDPIEYIRVK